MNAHERTPELITSADGFQHALDVLDNIACGLVVIDRQLHIVYINRWLQEQCDPIDLTSSPCCYEFFPHPPRNQPCPDCPALRTFADAGVYTIEVNSDSRKPNAWYRLTTSPITAQDGTINTVAELVVDISETKRLEKELRRSEKQHRDLAEYQRRILEQTNVGVAVLDLNATVLSWNRGAEKLFGYSPQEALGKSGTMLLGPQDAATRERATQSLRERGYWEEEFRLRKKDGRQIWVRGHVAYMYNDVGQPIATIAVLTDFSAEVDLRRRMQLSKQRLTAIVEHAPFEIGAVDSDGTVTLWNSKVESVTGIPKSQALCHSLAGLLPSDDHCRGFLAEIEKVFLIGQMREFEESAPKSVGPRKGQHTEELFWLVPVFGRDGQVDECVWFLWDATEFRRLQRELIRTARMAGIGRLAGGIAHESNNIMGGMKLHAQVALKKNSLEASQHALGVVLEGVSRAKKMSESLLSLASDRALSPRPANVREVMDRTLLLVECELGDKNISIVREYDDVPDTYVDPERLGQVFMNLITNARDSMLPDGGTATIRIGRDDRNILITVSDTGCGIPKHILDHIFEPFVTTKGPLGKGSLPGSGLGLSVSHSIVKDHGGTITVKTRLEEGSTFTIQLPIQVNPQTGDPNEGA